MNSSYFVLIHFRDTVKPLIPSGYYFVITLCNETKESEHESSEEEHVNTQAESLEECPMTNLNVYSFLFPNTPENDMCLLVSSFILASLY